jgi:hypothetical protein
MQLLQGDWVGAMAAAAAAATTTAAAAAAAGQLSVGPARPQFFFPRSFHHFGLVQLSLAQHRMLPIMEET